MEIRTIGYARTQWQRRQDAPHQPRAAPEVVGEIRIEPAYREALADLESFQRIWVIFLFHQSTGFAARVKPPRGGPKRGVLATRAPNRPSQILIVARSSAEFLPFLREQNYRVDFINE